MTDQADWNTLVNDGENLVHTFVESMYSLVTQKAALDAKFSQLDTFAKKVDNNADKDQLKWMKQLYLFLYSDQGTDLPGKLHKMEDMWAVQLAAVRAKTP